MAEPIDKKTFPSFPQLFFTLPSSDSDYIPTHSFRSQTEKGRIFDASIISRHLSDDLKRASWLESFIAPYLADLSDARERITYQKCLLSPIRRIPPEILQSIFLACLPQGFVEADPNTAPMLLCQVCKYWRDVALTLPALWASFKVRRCDKGTSSPALPLAELWLERSNPVPLSICLTVDSDRGCDPDYDDIELLMRLFLQHQSRWRSVHMCVRDLLRYEFLILEYEASTILEDIELCLSPDSYDSTERYDLGLRSLGVMVPLIWNSSSRLHSLTINATDTDNVLELLGACPNIRDCELHIMDGIANYIPGAQIILPLLHTLNIRARTSFVNLLNAITTPALRILTIKGEKCWSQTSFEYFINRSSCCIEEFSMININIGPDNLLRILQHIGTPVKILRIHCYPQGIKRPISDTILRGIASHFLVPNLEVLDLGCDSFEPEHDQLFVEMVLSRLDDRVVSRLGLHSLPSRLGSGTSDSHLGPSSHSGRLLRKICLSPDKDTAHMHETFIEALGREGMDVEDDPAWRAYRIDGWFREIRVWPGSN